MHIIISMEEELGASKASDRDLINLQATIKHEMKKVKREFLPRNSLIGSIQDSGEACSYVPIFIGYKQK